MKTMSNCNSTSGIWRFWFKWIDFWDDFESEHVIPKTREYMYPMMLSIALGILMFRFTFLWIKTASAVILSGVVIIGTVIFCFGSYKPKHGIVTIISTFLVVGMIETGAMNRGFYRMGNMIKAAYAGNYNWKPVSIEMEWEETFDVPLEVIIEITIQGDIMKSSYMKPSEKWKFQYPTVAPKKRKVG